MEVNVKCHRKLWTIISIWFLYWMEIIQKAVDFFTLPSMTRCLITPACIHWCCSSFNSMLLMLQLNITIMSWLAKGKQQWSRKIDQGEISPGAVANADLDESLAGTTTSAAFEVTSSVSCASRLTMITNGWPSFNSFKPLYFCTIRM